MVEKLALVSLALLALLLFSGTYALVSAEPTEDDVEMQFEKGDYEKEVYNMGEYQGPVPLGYDLEHFRETGETILEASK